MFKITSDEIDKKLDKVLVNNEKRFELNNKVIERLGELKNPTVKDLILCLECVSDSMEIMKSDVEIRCSKTKYLLGKTKHQKIDEAKRLRLLKVLEENADELELTVRH